MTLWLKIITTLIASLTIVACSKSALKESSTIVIGASNIPHAEILEFIKPILAEKGINLEIKIFNDYIFPNKALFDGDLDANFFQNIPYLEMEKRRNPHYKFSSIGSVHLEPMGIYSKRVKDISQVKNASVVLGGNNPALHCRIFLILQDAGLIKLKNDIDLINATVDDIVENPKNLQFKLALDTALLTQAYKNDEGDLIAINTNLALDAGLDPAKDPIFIESTANSPYANVVVVRTADLERTEFKLLMDVLSSAQVTNFINQKYKGHVLPANN